MNRFIILAVALVALPFVVTTGALAQSGPDEPTTAAVDVTVWRSVSDPSLLYVSTRPEGGRWRTLNTALDMSALSSSGNFHQSNAVRVAVPLTGGGTANVDVTVWRRVSDPSLLYVSTRPEGGRWRTLNTALDMSALSSSGNFHQSNAVRVEVPLGESGSDRAALVALYHSTEGASWTTSTNWLSGRPLGAWHGVTTNSDGRVTELDLSGNQLTGPIPAELGNLINLEYLVLGSNELTGPIPAELGDLTNLSSLHLGFNELTGPIPAELGDLINLEYLVLGSNELTGPIPAELGDLINLEYLVLGSNELTGPIPAELGDLINLEYLNLGGNELTGPIPAELGNLTNLNGLYLWVNQLTGPIPAELGNLTNLWSLHLGVNELTGPIPAWLGNLTNLWSLHLGVNELTGPIPAELGDLTNLSLLHLGDNQLTGPIPAELGDLTNLVELWLSGNRLMGCVPVGLRDVAEDNDLGELGLPDCGFEGRATAIQPLKIAFLADFSGPLAEYGPEIQTGVDLAIRHINDAGGVNGQDVVLVTGDTQVDTNIGVAAAMRHPRPDAAPAGGR